MSQHDFDITTADANTGVTFRAAVNAALQALASSSSGATAPTTAYPFQFFADSASDTLKMRNSTNTAWIDVCVISTGRPSYVPSSVSSTEIGYLDGVTSAIQTQINSKQATLESGTNIKTINSTSVLGSGDIATAQTGATQTFTASQRGTVTTDNDGSFDMSATNNFSCAPTGGFTLTFTNITAGQSGYVYLNNASGYTVAKDSAVKCNATFLATVSAAGAYVISYFSPDGTNVYVTASGAMS